MVANVVFQAGLLLMTTDVKSNTALNMTLCLAYLTYSVGHFRSLVSLFLAFQVFSRPPHGYRYKQFCLAHLFTSTRFIDGSLGLSYVASQSTLNPGGICSPGSRPVDINTC